MDFQLNDDQLEWRERCRAFASEVMRPRAPEYDRTGEFPWPVIEEASSRGLYGMELLQQLGADPEGAAAPIYAEQMYWGCAGMAMALGVSTGVFGQLAGLGTPEQLQRWGPSCFGTNGAPAVAAFALSEPGAGSDTRHLETRAVREGGEWVLTGSKAMVGNAGIAELTLVVASVEPELAQRGQATFILPAGTKGVEVGRTHELLGLRAVHLADLTLDRCRLPGEMLLGGEEALGRRLEKARARGATSRTSSGSAELTRPLFAAAAVGIGQAALDWTAEWLVDRETRRDGRSEQRLRHVLACAKVEVDSARLLTYRAASAARHGGRIGALGSVAKLKAAATAFTVCSALMDCVGAEAGSEAHFLGKLLRDSKALQIVEGSDQMLRSAVARCLLKGEPKQSSWL